MQTGGSYDVPILAANVDGQPAHLRFVADQASRRPGKIVMPATAACPRDNTPGSGPVRMATFAVGAFSNQRRIVASSVVAFSTPRGVSGCLPGDGQSSRPHVQPPSTTPCRGRTGQSRLAYDKAGSGSLWPANRRRVWHVGAVESGHGLEKNRLSHSGRHRNDRRLIAHRLLRPRLCHDSPFRRRHIDDPRPPAQPGPERKRPPDRGRVYGR